MSRNDYVYIGIKGTVLALDRTTGAERWRTSLRGSDFVNVVVDGDTVYAATKGELTCLDATTGGLRWMNKLSGLGYGMVSIGTPSGQQGLNAAEKHRRDAAAAAAAAAASS
jgi:outer membrane protein assembly factor BamB